MDEQIMQLAYQQEAAKPGTEQSSEPSSVQWFISENKTGIGHWSLPFSTLDSFWSYTQLFGLHFTPLFIKEDS